MDPDQAHTGNALERQAHTSIQTSNGPEPMRQPNHDRLRDAIYGVEGIRHNLEQLLRKIRGHDKPEEVGKESQEMMGSLSDILENGSNEINRRVNEANKVIDEIEELLF